MPASTPALLGVDLGTSAVKVVVVAPDGTVHGSAGREYPLHRREPGAAESDPRDWWSATRDAVRSAVGEAVRDGVAEIAGIGLDGQMHGLVLADDRGRPVRDALTWADIRAQDQLDAWYELPEADRARLANPITPGMLGPQLARIAQREPAVLESAAHALLPKDWLRQQLTGVAATEPSDASATLLWDVPADRWATDLLPRFGIPEQLLPSVRTSGEPAGVLLAEVAAELALPAGIPVAAGAGDTAAALLATGLQPGDTQLTVGSGAQLVRLRETAYPVADPVTHLYRAAEPGRWYTMAAVQNAGLALDWVRAVLGVDWAQLYGVLDSVDDARPGPVFVPYLTGERTPVLDAGLRARWDGLDLTHTREDLLVAALSGVAGAVRHALEAMPGPAPQTLRIAGGGTVDPRVRQLLADTLGVAVQP
ncbi:MAG TPA: FGGY family carbohydrate kinase, partial [Kineosporiaceae bacterium]|nr:FGGY family carbohydrate kinase [Kineosporiaceae bacterium]